MTSPAELERYFSSVRLPSHVDPPFRAQQFWNDSACNTILLPNVTRRYQTNWNGQAILTTGPRAQGPPVPDGHRAELVWLSLTVLSVDLSFLLPCSIVLTVFRNGSPVPGFVEMKTGYNLSSDAGSVGTLFTQMVAVPPRVCVPIHLNEGDTCDLEVHDISSLEPPSYFFDLRWCGWVYPISVEGEAGSIRQTLQDPGVASPLQPPTQAIRRRSR